jgi:hypothetical protein
MKKIIAGVLTILIILSTSVLAFAAYEEYPTVYVIGAHKNEIFNAQGKKIYPLDADAKAIIKSAVVPCLEELAFGTAKGDYSELAEEIIQALYPVFGEVILDKNGDVSNGSYTMFYTSTENIEGKTSGYDVWDARFWYDWRESPIKTAKELKSHIDNVIKATGKSKIQLIGRCYGANVIAAYLELYKDHAKNYISDVSYYSSSVMGIDFMSALYAGEIYLDEKAIDNFLNYYIENEDIIEGDEETALVSVLVEVLKEVKVLGLTGEKLTDFIDVFKDDMMPAIIRSTVGGWLSYWSMNTPDRYEKARDYIFNTEEIKKDYAGFIAKADEFYYKVQVNVIDTMKELDAAGINFYNFTKYNFPEVPVYDGATAQGDADTTVFRQSFGATASDYNEVLSKEYLDSVSTENLKYISPDKKIDASTCLFPDKTWFVKDLHHDYFGPLQDMSVEIMRYDMTVDNEKYPQFLTHTGKGDVVVNELVPTVGTDEDFEKPKSNIFATLIKFITAIVNYFTKLFKDGFTKK